jgi:hypothetical protein
MHRAKHAKRAAGPKLGKLLAMTGLAGALVLSLAVPAALAGGNSNSQGGTKGYVTDFNVDTCLPLEQNQIASDSTLFVDLKIPVDYSGTGSVSEGDLYFTIYENGTGKGEDNIVYGPTLLTPIDCPGISGNLWYVSLDVTGAELGGPGSYTLVVDYPDDPIGKNFSADSFTIYEAIL